MALRLRFDYGHLVPWTRRLATMGADARPNPCPADVDGPVACRALGSPRDFTVRKGDGFRFRHVIGPSRELMPSADAEQALAATTHFWTE